MRRTSSMICCSTALLVKGAASWAAPGLAAAALLFAVAGAVWSRQNNDEELRTSYDAVTESLAADVLPGAVQVVTAPRDGSSQREATFRYVMSH